MEGGKIQLILGPMFSGKSSELLRRIRRYKLANKRVIVIKHELDLQRTESSYLATHDQQIYEAVTYDKLESGLKEYSNFEDYDIIGIDEGQFFSDLALFSDKMANLGKIVIISALHSTFERKAFDYITQLIPLCEDITTLTAICKRCSADASFNYRIGQSKELIFIGNEESYIPLCRSCYFNYTQPLIHHATRIVTYPDGTTETVHYV